MAVPKKPALKASSRASLQLRVLTRARAEPRKAQRAPMITTKSGAPGSGSWAPGPIAEIAKPTQSSKTPMTGIAPLLRGDCDGGDGGILDSNVRFNLVAGQRDFVSAFRDWFSRNEGASEPVGRTGGGVR
jgi:hypothetical protein